MGAAEYVKDVAEFVKKFNDIELNRRILKLEEEVIDLTRDKRRADEKVEELERALRFKGNLKFKEPFYYLEGDKTPYCPVCWEDEHKAVHAVYRNTHNAIQYWDCPNCDAKFSAHGMPTHY